MEEGSAFDLTVEIRNQGTAGFYLQRLTCRSGSNSVSKDLGKRWVNAGGREQVTASLEFQGAGQFNLELGVELKWQHAARLGFTALLSGAIKITAKRRGPLIDARSEGLGSLVNISGGDLGKLLSDQLQTCDPAEAPRIPQVMRPMPPKDLWGPGAEDGIVSWTTELQVPNMLTWEGTLIPKSRPWDGVVLGRDRAKPLSELGDGHLGTDAVLRFPMANSEAKDLTLRLSRRHWRFYPWDGSWWIEQLGREPTMLVRADQTRWELKPGDKAPIAAGARIYALAGARHRLGFTLSHLKVEDGFVHRSALKRC